MVAKLLPSVRETDEADGPGEELRFASIARCVADEAIRADFSRRLSDFSRVFAVALASPSFVETTRPELLKRWKDDLGRFSALRASISLRYAERVDWREYEQRVRQLLNRHVIARDVVKLVEPLNIFDDMAIEARRKDKAQTDASIADTIAHQLTRSIEDKWDEDPTFFEKFSKLIRGTIADFQKGRIDELAYLAKVRSLREKVEQRQDDANPTPARLRDDNHAQAFWGLARRGLTAAGVDDSELAADIALEMSKKVQERRKVGWQNDRDIENLIRNDIDDFFFEELRGRRGVVLDPSLLDGIVDEMLGTARTRLAL
jgi:type I restriction enzyme, R subunit